MDNGGEEMEPEEAEQQDEGAFHDEQNYANDEDEPYDEGQVDDCQTRKIIK